MRWAFVEVVGIKKLSGKLDGQEVGSVMCGVKLGKPVPTRRRFYPERSKPILE